MKPRALHYRRCHLCGEISEGNGPVERCDACGKAMAPFYYFDEKTVSISEDMERSPIGKGQYAPVIGLSAYWPLPTELRR